MKIFSYLKLSLFCAILFLSQASYADDHGLNYMNLSLKELMDIKVFSASKKEESSFEAPTAISVVTSEDIRRSGLTSVAELLRLVPGLQVARVDSNKWAVSSRGFNEQFANKLLVMIDGRTIYTPLFSGVYWDVTDVVLEDIERIEVIRGQGATLWGANAVNGVINIITKAAKDTQGSFISTIHGTQDKAITTARHGGKTKDGDYYRAYLKYTNRNNTDIANSDKSNYDGWFLYRGGFRYDVSPSKSANYTLQGDVYSGLKDYLFNEPTLASPYFMENYTKGAISGGNFMFKLNDKLESGSSYNFQTYIDYTNRDIRGFFDQKKIVFDTAFEYNFSANDNHDIMWGTSYRNTYDDLSGGDYIDFTEGNRNVHLFSAFIQDKYAVIDKKLFVTFGAKLEHHKYTGFEFQPSVRASWLINEKHNLWSAISKSIRAPSRAEDSIRLVNLTIPENTVFGAGSPAAFASQIGNSAISSEELISYEIGYKYKTSDNFSLDMAAFYNDYDNLRNTQTLSAPSVNDRGLLISGLNLANYGYGESYGVELEGKWSVSDKWRLSASYAFVTIDLHLNNGATGSNMEKAEGKSPKNQAVLRSQFNLSPSIELDNSLYYVDSLPELDIDSFVRFDTRIGWKPTKSLSVDFVGQNLLDDKHKEFGAPLHSAQSEIARSYYIKATLEF